MTEKSLVHGSELLHRQVYKAYPDGTAMSVNFRPTKKDEGLLSTRQAAMVSAQQAFEEHSGAGHQTIGTWSFSADSTPLEVIDDSGEAGMPAGHASVDFTGMSRGACERAAKEIKAAATKSHPVE